MSIREKLMKKIIPETLYEYHAQYKIVNAKELAEFIKEMKIGEEVYFASTWDELTPPEKLDGSCCECWYGIKVIKAFGYKVAIFNYAGGNKAFAVEVDSETIEHDIHYYLRNFVEGTTKFHHVVLEY